jgi:uncharacterized membrane protein YbhN (UPF0104 family)/tRNA A-37 threonylcarbamoyl transferase component Bud32
MPNDKAMEPRSQETQDTATSWFFISASGARARRPADVAVGIFGTLLVFVTALRSDQVQWTEDFIGELVELLPSWLETTFSVVYGIGLVYALIIVVMAVSQIRTRKDLVRDIVITIGLSLVLVVVLTRLVSGSWPVLLPELLDDGMTLYPVVRVAFVTGILVVAGSQLVRPFRRVGWLIVALMFFIAIALGYGLPGDALGGLGVGFMSSSIVLVSFGSARGFPSVIDVAAGLRALGVDVEDLTVADYQRWGARSLDGRTPDGERLRVRVYGRDAKDAQRATIWWRSIWYRDAGPELTSSRLHQVEHEALLTIAARSAGVPCPQVFAAGEPSKELALIVLSDQGLPIATMDPDEVDDGLLVGLWESVGSLHGGGIAHGRLNEHAVRVNNGETLIENFHSASTAAPEERIQGDVAELLSSLVVLFGAERSVSVARRGLGDDALVAALPYIQRSAVSTEGRKSIPSRKSFFADIREEVARQTGVDAPKPAQLTRISWQSIFMFGLTLVAAYALIAMLGGIDFVAVWSELQDANWAWIVLALIVATSTLMTDAFALMAAVAVPVPLGPSIQLQSSIKFIQLAIGGAAGRMATNVAYLRKFGVSNAAAITQGGVDSLTGFLIQSVILVAALVFGNVELVPDDVTLDVDWALVLGLVLFAVVVSALMLRFVPAIRNKVIPPAKQMWEGLRDLGTNPSRLVQLFGSNLGSQLLFGLSLWMTAFAFGWTVPYMSALVIYVMMALLSGLLPIPGGVGVSEAVLTAGLVAIGVDEAAAFAIAVTFRVSSAYLPPVWGFRPQSSARGRFRIHGGSCAPPWSRPRLLRADHACAAVGPTDRHRWTLCG